MDMYLTADGERLRIPLLPDRLSVKMGATSLSFMTIKGSEHKIPRGKALTGYSWNGVFPGIDMARASYVHDWQQPTRIVNTLQRWMEDKKIIRFMVTETVINNDVFIENFVYEHFGVDNVSYTLTLTEYKKLLITTAPPQPEVVIPHEVEETPTVEEKPSGTGSQSDKPKNDNNGGNNGKKTDTQPEKMTVNIPTSTLKNADSTAKTSTPTILSTIIQYNEKSTLGSVTTSTGKTLNVKVSSKQMVALRE